MIWPEIISKYYPAASALRDIYMSHCQSVAALALEIADARQLPLNRELIEDAAMLHDVGIVRCNAPSIECRGEAPYICHGYIGADMLRGLGVDERLARVAETHTGSGLTATEIAAQGLPLPPDRNYLPQTLLERLICYADKFYSKSGDMKRKEFERVRKSMAAFGPDSLSRFDSLAGEFGRPARN